MSGRIAGLAWFAVKSFTLTVILGAVLTGYSCFQHGDRGPYPEVEWMWLIPVVAMLFVYAAEESGTS